MLTVSFLDTRDMLKMASLSKNLRLAFFTNLDAFNAFLRLFAEQIQEKNKEIE